MSKAAICPKRGDIIIIEFNPQAGHEQANRRPAVVLSDKRYNEKTSLAVVCPITGEDKGYPFQVRLPEGESVYGVILADHVKSLDWKAREAKIIGTLLDESIIDDVLAKLFALIDPD